MIGKLLPKMAFLSLSFSIKLSNAQLLSAYEQAYGPWKIKFTRNSIFDKKWYLGQPNNNIDSTSNRRKRKNTDLQLLFPPITQNIDENEPISAKELRSVPCTLTLQKNGKFTIELDCMNGDKIAQAATEYSGSNRLSQPTHNAEAESGINSSQTTIYSPMRGEWYITPNPYCVTDRHYDTLTLIAEPRIRRAHHREGMITELARIELRCRLSGRYGVGAVRNKLGMKHGREMGRMTHGTVMVIREFENINRGGESKKSTKREIIASFTGRGVLLACNDVSSSSSQDELDAAADEVIDNDTLEFDETECEF
jgi:hypothetical protein